MKTPAIPSAAATLVLVRDPAPSGVEVLLIQRHSKSKFAAGDYVFAGGKVEADDVPDDVEALLPQPHRAGRRRAARRRARRRARHWATGWGRSERHSRRSGCCSRMGRTADFVSITDDNRARFDAYRSACQAANRAFFDMLRAERLTLATDRLSYFAHWITPEENPIRFDTRFFAAVTPPGQEPVADGHEIVDVRWLTADETLEAIRRKEISLRTPTIKNLEIVGAAGIGGRREPWRRWRRWDGARCPPSAPACSRSTGGRSRSSPATRAGTDACRRRSGSGPAEPGLGGVHEDGHVAVRVLVVQHELMAVAGCRRSRRSPTDRGRRARRPRARHRRRPARRSRGGCPGSASGASSDSAGPS